MLTDIWHRVKCPPILIIALLHPPPGHNKCFHNFHSTNMAASSEGNVDALNIIEDIIPRLDSLTDPECVEGLAIRLEVLKRYLINIEIDDITLELVDRVCRSLMQHEQCYSASTTRPFTCAVATRGYIGSRGKPAYDIHEGQLNFLLEQGFKVSDVSSMMGVSTRTLEWRIHLLGMSMTGNKQINK